MENRFLKSSYIIRQMTQYQSMQMAVSTMMVFLLYRSLNIPLMIKQNQHPF